MSWDNWRRLTGSRGAGRRTRERTGAMLAAGDGVSSDRSLPADLDSVERLRDRAFPRRVVSATKSRGRPRPQPALAASRGARFAYRKPLLGKAFHLDLGHDGPLA